LHPKGRPGFSRRFSWAYCDGSGRLALHLRQVPYGSAACDRLHGRANGSVARGSCAHGAMLPLQRLPTKPSWMQRRSRTLSLD